MLLWVVLFPHKTSNLAREAAITAGIPYSTPCHTVNQACISANRAIATAIGEIATGQSSVIIAGGADSASETPIGYKKHMRTKLMKGTKIRTTSDMIKYVLGFKLKIFYQKFLLFQNILLKEAWEKTVILWSLNIKFQGKNKIYLLLDLTTMLRKLGKWSSCKRVVPVQVDPKFKMIQKDNGIRSGSKPEKLAKLRPAFDKKHGTLTAANSSFLSDGGAVCLL